MSFGPCRKLPGIFSYRIITAEEFPSAHARTRTEGPIEVFFNAAFVCSLARLFVCFDWKQDCACFVSRSWFDSSSGDKRYLGF